MSENRYPVAVDEYVDLERQLNGIQAEIRKGLKENGCCCPYDPKDIARALQNIIENRFIKVEFKELFSQPIFEKSIVVPRQFSIDANIAPNKEFSYGSISGCFRDECFEEKKISGAATLQIVLTKKCATSAKICEVVHRQDALAIIFALHHLLIEDAYALNQFCDKIIVVPSRPRSTSIVAGKDFNLILFHDDDDWVWSARQCDHEMRAGVYVALISQECFKI